MPKSKVKQENAVRCESTISYELEVPTVSDVVFRNVWCIKNYKKVVAKMDTLDSPTIRCAANGLNAFWNLSVRFWKNADGKRVKNPIVICLNLTKCEIEEPGQATVRYQFGIWDVSIKHWECCPVSRVALNLDERDELLSVGHRDLAVKKTHIDADGNVKIMIKMQVLMSEEERHSLSQDLARLLNHIENDRNADTEVLSCGNEDGDRAGLTAHSLIIRARSPVLESMLDQKINAENKDIKYTLDLTDVQYDLVTELLRYLYSDKVENLDTNAAKILPVATRYSLPGLSSLCERALLESLTPTNVASILLLADQCGCDNLRKTALNYCEDSTEIKENVQFGKSLAWKVMELVNPDLFLEACESLGSSYGSNLDSPPSDE